MTAQEFADLIVGACTAKQTQTLIDNLKQMQVETNQVDPTDQRCAEAAQMLRQGWTNWTGK